MLWKTKHLYTIYIIATIDMFLCSYSPYPCNSNPITTVYTHYTGLVCIMYLPPDVCIYIMYTYQMQDMYNTCCFPSPSATHPSPHPPFLSPPGRPQADRFPLICRGSAQVSSLTNREFFLARVAIVLAPRGFHALGSVKRL